MHCELTRITVPTAWRVKMDSLSGTSKSFPIEVIRNSRNTASPCPAFQVTGPGSLGPSLAPNETRVDALAWRLFDSAR